MWEGKEFEGNAVDVGGFGGVGGFVDPDKEFPNVDVGGRYVVNFVGCLFLVVLVVVVGMGEVGRSDSDVLAETVEGRVVQVVAYVGRVR